MISKTEKKAPSLRFPEFDGEWDEKKMGEVCKFTQGVQIPFSEQINHPKRGFIRYLYIRDFFSDDFPCYVQDKYPDKIISHDEIMMVNTGNTSGKAFMGANGVLSNNSFKISFNKDELDNQFLFAFLTSDFTQGQIRRTFNTGGQPHLGHKNIAMLTLFKPTLKEQQKIACFFTVVGKRIDELAEKKRLLIEYNKGVIQQLFSQQVRFTNDNGNPYPDWEEKSLGDICTKASSSISASSLEGNTGDYPVYGASGYIKSVDFYDEEEPYVAIVKDGAGVGRIQYCNARSSVLGTLDKLKPSKNINITFLYSSLLRMNFVKYVTGSTIPHIYFKDYTKENLAVPCMEEQKKIGDFLTSIDNKVEQVTFQLEQAKAFKKSLLQKMFV